MSVYTLRIQITPYLCQNNYLFQGVNLGFGDTAALARQIAEGLSLGEPFGSAQRLLDYETERQRRVVPMAAAIDALEHLYGVSSGGTLAAIRTLGVRVVDSSPVLKGIITNFAATG